MSPATTNDAKSAWKPDPDLLRDLMREREAEREAVAAGTSQSPASDNCVDDAPVTEEQPQSYDANLTFSSRGLFGVEAFVNGVSLGWFRDQEAAKAGAKAKTAGNGGDSHPMLAAALDLAKQRDWKVFPARMEDGKKWSWLSAKYAPGGENWGMTNEPAQLRNNFLNAKWRLSCGVGVPTGWVNRIFDIEGDTREGHGVDGWRRSRCWRRNTASCPIR